MKFAADHAAFWSLISMVLRYVFPNPSRNSFMDKAPAPAVRFTAECGRLTVDISAVRHNWRAIAARVAPARASAVVKADAYGLGAAKIVPALYDEGCRDFFTAHVSEALALRSALPADARLIPLNGLVAGTEADVFDNGLTPVLNTVAQVRRWSALLREKGTRREALLQFDSGMSRLGMSLAEAKALASDTTLLEPIILTHVMSHLASADEPASPQNESQRLAFSAIAALFPQAKPCLANSAGAFLNGTYHGALVRPGIALYGGMPAPGMAEALRAVVRLDVPVLQTHNVEAGAKVGYSGTHVTTGATRLATLAIGYADGLPRSLSGKSAAFFNGVRLPFAGRVSMDSVTVDCSALPEGTLNEGDQVEIIGPHQDIETLATLAGTISYEILTRLGARYARVYTDKA